MQHTADDGNHIEFRPGPLDTSSDRSDALGYIHLLSGGKCRASFQPMPMLSHMHTDQVKELRACLQKGFPEHCCGETAP